MPQAARPCGRPASHSVSHSRRPCSTGTYSSHPRSPTYEMREARTGTVPMSIERHVPNLNPSFETSSVVAAERMSRARGPHRPIVDIAEVRSCSWADPSAGRWSRNHFLSDMPEAPPVTTRNCSSPSRMIVRSDLNPPCGLSSGVYTLRPTGTSICRSATPCTALSAPGPVMSKIVKAERSKMPARSRIARCSAVERRPPARLPFRVTPRDAVAELVQQRGVRLVPERPLPTRGLEEERLQLALALVERRQPHVAVRGPLLGRVDDAVGLVEALGRPRANVGARLLVLVEARRVRGVHVDLRLAVHHPLGQRLAGARAFLHPDGRRRPEAADVRRLAKDRH